MSVYVSVSYQEDDELLLILDRLEDLPLKVSSREYRSGQYKRCYLRCEKPLTVPRERESKYPSA